MSKCIDPSVITHNIQWQPQQCVDGGVLRAIRTYTNLETSGFNTPIGYSGHYYGIRKYTGLIPNAPYSVSLELQTGDGSRLEVPREIREWEYGSNENVAYSGTKIVSNYDSNQFYAKSVSVNEDYLAVGMPFYTFEDTEGHLLTNAGTVVIYKRNAAPSGSDWSDQYDKADWIVEQEIKLPSGILRDYIDQKITTKLLPNLQKELPFAVERTIWKVGQNGRQLGHSIDLCSTDNLEPSLGEDKKNLLVVSGPSCKFDRTFQELTPSGVGVGMFVFTDNFAPVVFRQCPGSTSSRSICPFGYEYVERSIADLDLLFRYFAKPATKFDVKVAIIESVVPSNTRILQDFPEPKPSFITKKNIIRHQGIINLQSPDFQLRDNDIFESLISTFFELFPYDETKLNNNIPAIMGFFVDDTASFTERAVNPALSRFIDFYKAYSFASGLKTITGEPSTGHVVITKGVRDSWAEEAALILSESLDLQSLQQNDIYKLFADSIGSINPDVSEFNEIPFSGGAVYIFEKESGYWNLIQEINSPTKLNNVPPDRFGHCVRISDNGEIISIGSPYLGNNNLQVYEYNSNEKDRLYNSVGFWLSIKASEETTSTFYKNLLSTYSLMLQNNVSPINAGKHVYIRLSETEKFKLRKDLNIIEYQETFSYSNPVGSLWSFLIDEVAPSQRLGYSVAVNEDGSIVAVGAPTDSFTEDNDVAKYFAPNRPQFTTWPSYINAGSVTVFESRKYFPHNLVVDYGKFGNLHFESSSDEEKQYFNYFDSIYRSMGLDFKATEFVDPVIPEEAGLVFIISPQIDALSDEVFNNIRNWLALGDRNLVLVGNDPVWEQDGLYTESNRIINKLLRRLNSGLEITQTRNQYESLPTYELNKPNITLSFKPDGSLNPISASPNSLYGSGVGDIKPFFPNVEKIYNCSVGKGDALSFSSIFDRDLSYAAANDKCEIPIYHLGDLRSQWNEWCLNAKNEPITYPFNWPLFFGAVSPKEYGCAEGGDGQTTTDNIVDTNFLPQYNFVPLLVAAEYPPAFEVFIPETPPTSGLVIVGEQRVPNNKIFRSLGEPDSLGQLDIIWSSESGNFTFLDINTTNVIEKSKFFDPNPYNDKDGILQAKSDSFIESVIVQKEFDFANYIASEQYANTSSNIIILAGTFTETKDVLNNTRFSIDGDPNYIYRFYRNLLYKTSLGESRIAQLGGWTGRSSFQDLNSESILDSVITEIFCDVDLNVSTEQLLRGMERFGGIDEYDICWIVEPKNLPNNDELESIKSWLARGNKKIIITYQDYSNESVLNRINTLSKLLNISIGPMFLPNKNRYARINRDLLLPGNIRQSPPVYINSQGFVYKPFATSKTIDIIPTETDFVPLRTGQGLSLAFVGSVQDGINLINSVSDDFVKNEQWWRLNTGTALVKFPTIKGSGYNFFVSTASESVSENKELQFEIQNVFTNLDSFGDPSESVNLSIVTTPRNFSGDIITQSIRFVAQEDSTSIRISHNLFRENNVFQTNNDIIPRTTRLIAISGVVLPVESKFGFDVIPIRDWQVFPGSLPSKITVVPSFRPISTDNSKYCPDAGKCLEQLGNKLIEDGPVVLAQEVEKFSRFDFGVNRSRITVISDSSMIQGKTIVNENNQINNNVISLLQGLYPFTSFPSETRGRSYTDHITKIQSKEISSPAILYNLTGNIGNNLLFQTPTPAESGRSLSEYIVSFDLSNFKPHQEVEKGKSPTYVEDRPSFPPITNDAIQQEKDALLADFINQTSSWGSYPKFAGIIEGKYYEDIGPKGGIPQIMQDTGYDYLDFDRFPSGYPGNLFGYSIDLYRNKLLIGSPFAPFTSENIIPWSDIVSTSQYTVPSGLLVGYNGGAGVVYLYEQITGDGVTTVEDRTLFDKSSRWTLTEKFRPEQINIGQDVFSSEESLNPSILGQNNYASGDLSLSIVNDQFGHSVKIFSDMIAIGAPGHDFSTYVDTIYENGSFMRKAFDNSLDIPERIIYDLGSSGLRNQLQDSGVVVLNNGAIFTYENRMDDWQTKSQSWSFIEKIVPQGYNARKQKNYINNVAVSGSENDRFGSNIDIFLSKRSDSDYTLAAGVPAHKFADSGSPIANNGAVYIYDGILRRMPTAKVDPDSWMQGRLFGATDNQNNPIMYFGFSNSGTDLRIFQSGIIYSNEEGEIFLEASGQDITEKLYIRHRPFVKSIYGRYFFGEPSFDRLSMFIDGDVGRDNQGMNLFFGVKDSHQVYNQLGLYQNSILGIASGVPSGLNLSIFTPEAQSVFNSGLMLSLVSGIGLLDEPDFLRLRVRGK
jgi:hypothetical protein